jgi:SAM-dependent methyltransferase
MSTSAPSERPARVDPYDQVPYRSYPIEWSAPERLAVTALLHGGPRIELKTYRALELGCGDGANLIPMAYYRRQATFVGVDGAGGALASAEQRRAELGLGNLELVHADFRDCAARLTGTFDFVLMHGVLSWVAPAVREVLLDQCSERLRPGGLLYLNYNARPGWNIRGLVRELLLKQTAELAHDLGARTARALQLAATFAASFAEAGDHPYTRLMERELRFICAGHPTYIAHEFLAPENHPFWRSELLALAARRDLHYVADADFNYPSGRVDPQLAERITGAGLGGPHTEDTLDLLSYRQLHSPIFTRGPLTRRPATTAEIAQLIVASCLDPIADQDAGGVPKFRHPNGFEVEARTELTRAVLAGLRPRWPRGLRVGDLFDDVAAVTPDLALLHHHGLIDLRLLDTADGAPPAEPLNAREAAWGGYRTSPYHTWTAS